MSRRVATAKSGPAWPARPKRLAEQLEQTLRWLSEEGEKERRRVHAELDQYLRRRVRTGKS
jgi:hypothetical protein